MLDHKYHLELINKFKKINQKFFNNKSNHLRLQDHNKQSMNEYIKIMISKSNIIKEKNKLNKKLIKRY